MVLFRETVKVSSFWGFLRKKQGKNQFWVSEHIELYREKKIVKYMRTDNISIYHWKPDMVKFKESTFNIMDDTIV